MINQIGSKHKSPYSGSEEVFGPFPISYLACTIVIMPGCCCYDEDAVSRPESPMLPLMFLRFLTFLILTTRSRRRRRRKIHRSSKLSRSRQPRRADTGIGDPRRRLRRPSHVLEPAARHDLADVVQVVGPVAGQGVLVDAARAQRRGPPDVEARVGAYALQLHEVFCFFVVVVEVGVYVADAAELCDGAAGWDAGGWDVGVVELEAGLDCEWERDYGEKSDEVHYVLFKRISYYKEKNQEYRGAKDM